MGRFCCLLFNCFKTEQYMGTRKNHTNFWVKSCSLKHFQSQFLSETKTVMVIASKKYLIIFVFINVKFSIYWLV